MSYIILKFGLWATEEMVTVFQGGHKKRGQKWKTGVRGK